MAASGRHPVRVRDGHRGVGAGHPGPGGRRGWRWRGCSAWGSPRAWWPRLPGRAPGRRRGGSRPPVVRAAARQVAPEASVTLRRSGGSVSVTASVTRTPPIRSPAPAAARGSRLGDQLAGGLDERPPPGRPIDWPRLAGAGGAPAAWTAGLDERGSASVLVALWAVVLTMLAAGAVVLSSALAVRETVSAAADLAALAGASATLDEPEQACARAGAIAGRTVQPSRSAVWGAPRCGWWRGLRPRRRCSGWRPVGEAHLRARAHAQLTAQDP